MKEVWLLALRLQQVGDQALQGGGLQPTHLHSVVLDKGSGELGCVGGRQDGFPPQRDAKHCPVFLLLAPLLHRVLQLEHARSETRTPVGRVMQADHIRKVLNLRIGGCI